MKKIYKYNKKKFITAFKLFFMSIKKVLSLREKLFFLSSHQRLLRILWCFLPKESRKKKKKKTRQKKRDIKKETRIINFFSLRSKKFSIIIKKIYHFVKIFFIITEKIFHFVQNIFRFYKKEIFFYRKKFRFFVCS